jgi:ABC-2 type transport system permease protein
MTSTTMTPGSAGAAGSTGAPVRLDRGIKVTQARVITSEWIKLHSLRSTMYTLITSVGMTVGLSLLFSWFAVARLGSHGGHLDTNGVTLSLRGAYLAQLAIGVLGVLLITGEYSTGMIRATMSAVPRRLPVLWAKLGMFAVVALVVSEAASFAAFLGGQAILSSKNIGASLADPGVLRVVIGAGLYLTVVGLLGMALGFLIRNTAGAITTLFGILLVLPVLGEVLPSDWAAHIVPYLPSNAGQAIMALHSGPGTMAPWTGFALFVGYTAAAVVAAAVLLRRRDA